MNDNHVRMANVIALLAGLWIIASPFVLQYDGVENAVRNGIIVGTVIAVISLLTIMMTARRDNRSRQPWLSWALVALGAWMIAAPHVLDYSGVATLEAAEDTLATPGAINAATWSETIAGLVTMLMGLWSAVAIHTADARQHRLEEDRAGSTVDRPTT